MRDECFDRVIERDGCRYRYFAGPFADQIDAFDFAHLQVERGEFTEDDVLVEGNGVYILEKETQPVTTDR